MLEKRHKCSQGFTKLSKFGIKITNSIHGKGSNFGDRDDKIDMKMSRGEASI